MRSKYKSNVFHHVNIGLKKYKTDYSLRPKNPFTNLETALNHSNQLFSKSDLNNRFTISSFDPLLRNANIISYDFQLVIFSFSFLKKYLHKKTMQRFFKEAKEKNNGIQNHNLLTLLKML